MIYDLTIELTFERSIDPTLKPWTRKGFHLEKELLSTTLHQQYLYLSGQYCLFSSLLQLNAVFLTLTAFALLTLTQTLPQKLSHV